MPNAVKTAIAALIGAAVMIAATAGATAQQPSASAPIVAPVAAPTIRSWGYQLQGIDPPALAAAPYDAIVIDYARDGRHENALTPAEVASLKIKPDGSPRVVVEGEEHEAEDRR